MKRFLLYFLSFCCCNIVLFAQDYNKWNMNQNEIDSIYDMVMKSPGFLKDFENDSVLYEKCLYAISQEEILFKNRLKHREDSLLSIVYDRISCRFFLDGKEVELSNDFEVFFIVNALESPYKIQSQIYSNYFSYPFYYKDPAPVLFVFKYKDVLIYKLEDSGIRQSNNIYEYVIRVETKDNVNINFEKQAFSFSIAHERPCSTCANIHYSFTKIEYDSYGKYLEKKHLKKKQISSIIRYLENQ